MDLLNSLDHEKILDAKKLKTKEAIDLDKLLANWKFKWNEATTQLSFNQRNELLKIYLVNVLDISQAEAGNFIYGHASSYHLLMDNYKKSKSNQEGYVSFWKNVQKEYPSLVEKEEIEMLSFFQRKSAYTLFNALIDAGSTGALEEFAFITHLLKD